MTVDQAMLKVSAALDEIYADALVNAADMIKRHNPTREEFESFMQWQTETLAADRAKKLRGARLAFARWRTTAVKLKRAAHNAG